MAKAQGGGHLSPVLVVGTLLLALAAGLLVTYRVVGSYVDADGFLHEPFACIPLAWLCGLGGAVLVAIAIVRGRRGRRDAAELNSPTVR